MTFFVFCLLRVCGPDQMRAIIDIYQFGFVKNKCVTRFSQRAGGVPLISRSPGMHPFLLP